MAQRAKLTLVRSGHAFVGARDRTGLPTGGLDAQTPAALISNASASRPAAALPSLKEAVDTLKESGLGSPCVFVIGDVVRTGDPAAPFGDGSYFRVAEREHHFTSGGER